MSDEIVVSVRDVTKKYRLFASHKDRLKEALHPFRRRYHNEFWALREVSFDIPRGQVIGILGRNGSGKSTLLQIIAGILQPTTGSVVVNGQIAAILQLGIGFNPEFTGRENVILYGSILGLSRNVIINRLREIEYFADIGRFFDQPLKTYSSGMVLRLGFAVAVAVDPDVLIVDEALAVGDAKFQERCFAKISTFKQAGKTILIVSHDLRSIAQYCDLALLLEQGAIIMRGSPDVIINKYYQILAMPELVSGEKDVDVRPKKVVQASLCTTTRLEFNHFFERFECIDDAPNRLSYNPYEHRYGNGNSRIIDYLLVSDAEIDPAVVHTESRIDLYVKIRFLKDIQTPMFGLAIKTKEGVVVYGTNTILMGSVVAPAVAGSFRIIKFSLSLRITEPDIFIDLGSGEYRDEKSIALDRRYSIIHLQIVAGRKHVGLTDLSVAFQDELTGESQ